jgi:hypothetical protein
MSRHFAAKARRRSAYRGSSRSRWPYSFIVDPQPAALMTTVSTLAASNASIVRRARVRRLSRPAWTISAPQQRCAGG